MTRPHRILLTTVNSATAAQPPQNAPAESDFVVVLAALLCAIICAVGLVAVARCAWLRRRTAGDGRPAGQPNKGLKKKTLQSLPRYTYGSSTAGSARNEAVASECAICLAEYVLGDEIRVLPQCGHGFHVTCIDTWLGSHSSCPSCRQILVVARCHKCGEFPALPVPGAPADSQVKASQDRTTASSSRSTFLP